MLIKITIIVLLRLLLIVFLGFIYIFITKDWGLWSNKKTEYLNWKVSPESRTCEHDQHSFCLYLTQLHVTPRKAASASELSLRFGRLELYTGRVLTIGILCCLGNQLSGVIH